MDRTCYVYVVGWRNIDRWYCGVRYRKGCHPADLWVSYYTSSKDVAKIRVEHGDPDVIRVMRVFKANIRDARDYEQRLLTRFKVLESDRWINKAIGGHYAGRIGPHTEETKRKISQQHLGKKRGPVSEEQKQKQRETFKRNYEANREARFAARSATQKGRTITPEHRARISSTLTGTKMSEETKQKISAASSCQSAESRQKQADAMRNKKWFTNGTQTIRTETCPDGFWAGRPKMPARKRSS